MKTIQELNKERLLVRKENPQRYSVLSLLIDGASKIAKEENRSVEEKDLFLVAQRSVKEIDKDIDLTNGDNEFCKTLKAEKEIWKEFLPKLLTLGEIKRIVLQTYTEDFLVQSNFSSIMKEMKLIKDMDMSLLSKVLKETLK